MNTTTTDVSHPLRLTHIVRQGSSGVETDIALGDNVRVTAGRGKRAFGHIPLNLLDTSVKLEERYKFTAFTISSDEEVEASEGHIDPEGVSVQRIKVRDDCCVVELKLFRRGWFVSVVLQVEDLVTGKMLHFLSETFNAHNNGKEKSMSEKLRQAQEKRVKKNRPRSRRTTGRTKKRSSSVAFEQEQESTETVAFPAQKRPFVATVASSPDATLPPAPEILQQPWPQRAVPLSNHQAVHHVPVAQALEIDVSLFGSRQQDAQQQEEEEQQQANEDVGDLVLELGELMEQDPAFASDFTQFLDAESVSNAQNSFYPDVATLSWRFPQFGSLESEAQPNVPIIRTGSAMWDAISMPNGNDVNYLDFQQPIAVEQDGLFLQE